MSDENALRIKARTALDAGRIPYSRPRRMWGGPGAGVECSICFQPIQRDEIGFELDFGSDGERSEPAHHVHLRCFSAWDRERRTFEVNGKPAKQAEPAQQTHPLSATATGGSVPGGLLPSCKDDGRIGNQNDDSRLASDVSASRTSSLR
jgi:hypothetical protein